MLCPYCQQEHPESTPVCPNTGLALGQLVRCTNCGQPARPGARYCAHCGRPLPLSKPGAPLTNGAAEAGDRAAPADDQPALPPDSQRWTRPSVSLVELSRRETRRARPTSSTLQRAKEQWERQSRIWHFVGYTLLILVVLAGAAGLFLLWGQLHP
jgi:hypothetical protein